jgi:DNA-binding MarR family transcriptional regulator/GNAT superfamily N-acetyltransferase
MTPLFMPREPNPSEVQIAAVRGFNRFYTGYIGVLNRHLLKSKFSVTEARLLYELASRDGATATDIGRDLKLDAGYLSRLLKKFAETGLLKRVPSKSDARQTALALTAAGRATFKPLNRDAHDQVLEMLKQLSAGELQSLLRSMKTLQRLLSKSAAPLVPYIVRSLRPGDIGWITHRQGLLYFQEYGWDETFEALVAEIVGKFVKTYDRKHEQCWVAARGDEVVGSVFLVRETEDVAKLRLLYVEPSARGLGIGRRLVDECVEFAKNKGYKTLALWTNDVLVSARRIYHAAGFKLVGEERHHSFGKDLVGQNWALDLT